MVEKAFKWSWNQDQNKPFSSQFELPGTTSDMQYSNVMNVPEIRSDLFKQNSWTPFELPGVQSPGTPQVKTPNISGGFMNPELSTWRNFLPSQTKEGQQYSGYGMPLLGLAKGAADTYLGFKNLGVAEDTLDFQKKAFSDQFNIQKNLVNTELADRAKRMYEANPELNLSPDAYMKKYGV